MESLSLLTFDLDGTLVDTLDDIAASVNHALARLGQKTVPKEDVGRYVGDGIEATLTRSLGGSTLHLAQALDLFREHYRRNMLVHARLYPGVREVLEYFGPIPKAVISNKSMEFIVPVLDGLGIARYFRTAIGANRGFPLKPAPDSLNSVMARFGVSRQRTAIVGDGTADMLAGKAAGIITCAVTYGYRSENELRAIDPDYMVHSLLQLKTFFFPALQKDA